RRQLRARALRRQNPRLAGDSRSGGRGGDRGRGRVADPRDLSATATLASVSAETGPEPTPFGRAAVLSRPHAPLPGTPPPIAVGAGSFGTAVAVLLARAAVRTTLQTRTEAQALRLSEHRMNEEYLPGVELPAPLRIEPVSSGVHRADYVFLAVPSTELATAI